MIFFLPIISVTYWAMIAIWFISSRWRQYILIFKRSRKRPNMIRFHWSSYIVNHNFKKVIWPKDISLLLRFTAIICDLVASGPLLYGIRNLVTRCHLLLLSCHQWLPKNIYWCQRQSCSRIQFTFGLVNVMKQSGLIYVILCLALEL